MLFIIYTKAPHANKMASAQEFLSAHLGQLMSIGLPEDLIPNLYSKLFPNLVFDAGEVFVFSEKSCQEGRGQYNLIAKTDIEKHGDVFLVDHAWTNDGGIVAKQQLEKMPQLLSRMQNMFALTSIDDTTEENEDYIKSHSAVSKLCSCSLEEARLALNETNYCIIDAIMHVESGDKTYEKHQGNEDESHCSYEEFKKAMSSCAPRLSAADISESYMEKMYAGFLKQKGKGVGAAMTSNYNWTDSLEDGFVYVYVAIKPCTKKQDINSQLSSSHWKLEVDNMGGVIDGDLSDGVLPDESYWSIESPGVLCMALRKKSASEKLWTELIPGEKQLSAEEIELAAWKDQIKKSVAIKEVLDSMWLHNQTYSIGSTSDHIKQQAPKWYVMDEVGCSMQHSSEPNFACMPFFFLHKGLAVSLIWPLRDVKGGEIITRRFIPKVLPEEPTESYEARLSAITSELVVAPKTLPVHNHPSTFQPNAEGISIIYVGVNHASITKKTFYCDYINSDALGIVVAKFGCNASDTLESADVLLLSKQPNVDSIKSSIFVNHFKNEETILRKDQLAKHVHQHFGYPSWFPETFALQTELTQFIATANQKPNCHWIIHTSDSSNTEFEPVVTTDLLRISRLTETGNIVASEFSLLGPLYKGRKFALSFTAVITQTKPTLQMYIHKHPFLRMASTQFDQKKIFDEYDTSSLITKKPKEALDRNRQQDFEDFKKAMNEAAKKNQLNRTWNDIEKEIFSCSGQLFNSLKDSLASYDRIKSFALVGIDFVLNSKLRPILLGVDSVPIFANNNVLADTLCTVMASSCDTNTTRSGDSLVEIVSV